MWTAVVLALGDDGCRQTLAKRLADGEQLLAEASFLLLEAEVHRRGDEFDRERAWTWLERRDRAAEEGLEVRRDRLQRPDRERLFARFDREPGTSDEPVAAAWHGDENDDSWPGRVR